jgi:hypothetical protein
MIAHDPFQLPHPAPTLGEDAQAHERIRMTDTSRSKPLRNMALYAAPRQLVTLDRKGHASGNSRASRRCNGDAPG